MVTYRINGTLIPQGNYPKSMNFISLEPSLQQPNLNQKKVYCATKTVLGAFMIMSFLVYIGPCLNEGGFAQGFNRIKSLAYHYISSNSLPHNDMK